MSAGKYLKLLACSKSPLVRNMALNFVIPPQNVFCPSEHSTRLIFAGDTSFDNELRSPPYGVYRNTESGRKNNYLGKVVTKISEIITSALFDQNLYSTKHCKYKFSELSLRDNEDENKFEAKLYGEASQNSSSGFNIGDSRHYYPFREMSDFFKSRDYVVVNLETALAKSFRACGMLISDAGYAEAMKNSGISSVCLANNHIFDAGENGFLQTLEYLNKAGISYAGAGSNLEEARKGTLVQLNGYRINILNYTNYCNSNFASVASDYPGILPLDRDLVKEDIERSAKTSDFVFISLHWGIENQPNVHPKQVEYAHSFIDAGADAIIGHHPHIPHGIEVYNGKPIIYSLGNFIFGRGQGVWKGPLEWGDNFLAELVIDDSTLQGVIIHPISGRGEELFQPRILRGVRADNLLEELQIKSAVFDTGIAIEEHVGYIKL